MRSAIAVTVLACGLLAGCGTTSSRTAAPQASSSREPRYLAAGNAICQEQLAQLNRLQQPTTPAQTVSYLPRALVIIKREAARLGALHTSNSGAGELAAALASTQRLTVLLTRFLDELRHGMVEFAALTAVQSQSMTVRAQIDSHFRQAGLPRCAE